MNVHRLGNYLAVLALIAAPAAAKTVYNDRATFEATAGGPLSVEEFNLDVANNNSITFANGIQSVGTGSAGSPINAVGTGVWNTKVRTAAGIDGYLTITWTFPRATNAFGVDWGSISSSRGVTLTGNWDGTGNEAITLWDALGLTSTGFVGIIGNSTFTQVTLTALGTGDNDVFSADNVTIRGGTGIFSDGFESSNTGAWSATVP